MIARTIIDFLVRRSWLIGFASVSGLLSAAETEAPPELPPSDPRHGSDEIAHQLDRQDHLRGSIEPTPFLRSGTSAWTNATGWIDQKIGLRLGVAYDTLVQGASVAHGDAFGAAGDLTLLARWRVWGRGTGWEGTFGFNGRFREAFTDTAPSTLGASIGSLWSTTDGFTDKGWELPEAWFEQKAWEGRLAIRTGQLNIRTLFDTASLRSARLYFLNTAFSLNPAVPFPLFGAGSVLFVKPTDELELRLGVTDARARRIDGPFDTVLRSDDLFVAGTASWTPKWLDAGRTRLQVTGWHIDPTRDGVANDGGGASVLVEQRFDESGTTVFARWAWSSSKATVVESVLTAGVGWKPIPGRAADLCGVAVAWGSPRDSTAADQSVLEAFYRYQATPELQLTPDLQVVVHPSGSAAADTVAVFGLRARLSF